MSLASPRVYAWLSSVLRADSSLVTLLGGSKVYHDEAPQGTAPPYIVLANMSDVPIKVLGNVEVWSEDVFLVKGIDRSTSQATLEGVMNRADAVLNGSSGTVTNGTVFFCASEDAVKYIEHEPGGPVYQHLGRRWRIQAKATG